MDTKNLFMTPATARLVRAEYGLGLVVCLVLFFAHLDEVRWPAAVALFVYIDLIGYLPGTYRYHRDRARDRRAGGIGPTRIPKAYYVLYNVMHSMVTQGLLALVWITVWGFEWALLALPIHLLGDRALFGTFLKPFALSFEPETHPAYRCLTGELEGPATAAAKTSAPRPLRTGTP